MQIYGSFMIHTSEMGNIIYRPISYFIQLYTVHIVIEYVPLSLF